MNMPSDHEGQRSGPGDDLPDYHEEASHSVTAAPGWLSDAARIRKYLFRGTLLLLIILFGPHAYRSLKSWRSSCLLEKSGKAFAVGDPLDGLSLLKQALALSPGSPEIQQAVQLYDARVGDKSSQEILLARMREGESSPEELLGIAEIKLRLGDKILVEEALSKLPKHLDSAQSLRSALLRSAIMAQNGQFSQAAEFCMEKAKSLSGDDSCRLQIQAAALLLDLGNHGDPEAVSRAKGILEKVVGAHSGSSLPAWRILARLESQPHLRDDAHSDHGLKTRLISAFGSLRDKSVSDQLLEADLEILSDPSRKMAVVKKLTKEYAQSDRAAMLEYARWLNAKGMREDVIAFAGADRTASDTDWLLIVLDAKCGLGKWGEVGGMLSSPAAAGIPDAVRHLFLARAATMSGSNSLAEEEWRNVGGSLPLEKPETLAYIAGYEEQIGALDRASRAYREMADRKESRIQGLVGLIRCQPRNASESKLIPLYEELLLASPDYTEAQGDLAYLKLLGGVDVQSASTTAEKLLASHPESLARISTAALSRLKNGDSKGALELYRGKVINWQSAPDPWKAVYVTVLRANGDPGGELKSFPSIDTSSLRPKELELLKKTPAL
jgi:hypothetical protein